MELTHGLGLCASDLGLGRKTLRLFSVQFMGEALRAKASSPTQFWRANQELHYLSRSFGNRPHTIQVLPRVRPQIQTRVLKNMVSSMSSFGINYTSGSLLLSHYTGEEMPCHYCPARFVLAEDQRMENADSFQSWAQQSYMLLVFHFFFSTFPIPSP